MGEAFITRRGSGGGGKEQKITFNDTPMVLTKTLSNALSVGRFNMAVASDNEYISFLCGMNSSGSVVSNIDIFSRSGQHYVAYWPEQWTDMAAVITNNWLIGLCGRGNDTVGTRVAMKWHMYNAIRNYGQPVNMTTVTNYDPLYGACAARFDDGIIAGGGLINSGSAYDNVWKYSFLNQNNVNNNAGYQYSRVSSSRGFATMGQVTSTCAMMCGGVRLDTNVLFSATDIITKGVNGSISVTSGENLSVAQYAATQANIYTQGRTYLLVGLGLKLPESQGNLFKPPLVVPNIDVYASATVSGYQISSGKYSTFTLPLGSNPISAAALGFGDCVLYIVGYLSGVTKGYLVQLEPLRVTTINFNFKRTAFTAGVIGNDVGFLAGGIKNGDYSRDVEVIQLLRNVPIYPGMKYKVGSMASEETSDILTLHPLNDEIKLSGYMKL